MSQDPMHDFNMERYLAYVPTSIDRLTSTIDKLNDALIKEQKKNDKLQEQRHKDEIKSYIIGFLSPIIAETVGGIIAYILTLV